STVNANSCRFGGARPVATFVLQSNCTCRASCILARSCWSRASHFHALAKRAGACCSHDGVRVLLGVSETVLAKNERLPSRTPHGEALATCGSNSSRAEAQAGLYLLKRVGAVGENDARLA